MYYWRRLTDQQRKELLNYRISTHSPHHSPPQMYQIGMFHITAACFEHHHYIGLNPGRIAEFSEHLLETIISNSSNIVAWVVLPNHYHCLVDTKDLRLIKTELGKLHGRISRKWNLEENKLGRQVWYRCMDRRIRNERHYWATVNYINNNPVHHGYVQRWQEWPFSSAEEYINKIGKEQAETIWKEYPVMNYGAGWDDKNL